MILAIIGIAVQAFGWFRDFTKTKEGISIGLKEGNKMFRNKDGSLNVMKAVLLGIGLEYGIAIGAYFFTEALKNSEQSSQAGWYAFGCVLIGFGVMHFIASLKWAKLINYAKTQRVVR